jgi:hypothetical protein
MKVALALRGHIRDGLIDARLRQFVEKLMSARRISTLDIYCHTWKEHEAKSSYRVLDRDVTIKVTPDLIKHYFGEGLRDKIKSIEITDDTKLVLKGNLEGKVAKSLLPLIAWKRMWAGKRKLIDTIAESGVQYDKVINTRYDLFTHHLCLTSEPLLMRIFYSPLTLNFKYPVYTRNPIGVDNFYVGSLHQMQKLIHSFDDRLDEILERNPEIDIQEKLVYEYAKDNRLILR